MNDSENKDLNQTVEAGEIKTQESMLTDKNSSTDESQTPDSRIHIDFFNKLDEKISTSLNSAVNNITDSITTNINKSVENTVNKIVDSKLKDMENKLNEISDMLPKSSSPIKDNGYVDYDSLGRATAKKESADFLKDVREMLNAERAKYI